MKASRDGYRYDEATHQWLPADQETTIPLHRAADGKLGTPGTQPKPKPEPAPAPTAKD